MTCAWHVPDDGVGPAALSGHVRLLKNSGGWELRETANGGGVAVRYRVLTDPGTALPGFLVDLANQSSVPDVMRAFNARATSGVYEREDAARGGGIRIWIEPVSRRAGQRRRRQGARGAAPVGGLREDHDVAVGAAAKDGDRVGREGRRPGERERRVTEERRTKEDGERKEERGGRIEEDAPRVATD